MNNNVLEYLEENININNTNSSCTQLQVFNNAAFDAQHLSMKSSWSSSSDCTKENLSPNALNKNSNFKNHRNIDDEIAEIESEITRLTSKLESLRLEKSNRKIAASEKRVRIVAAKFMEPKKNAVVSNKVIEHTPKRNAVVFKDATPKRNVVVSMDKTPKSNWRRGMSLGPMEIAGRMQPPSTTPATQNRRKSCFWKKEEIDEHRRKTICKANTVGANAIKRVKKKEEELNQVQPRNLFAEIDKSKKVLKQGRVVASRYNSNSSAVDARKRSFPENSSSNSKVRVKKRWEIPVEDVDVSEFGLLPKISTLRCGIDESPRDSGAAKRVAELKGKKSYFCPDDDEEKEGSACQLLSFAEDDGEQ